MKLSIDPHADILLPKLPLTLEKTWPTGSLRRGPLCSHFPGCPCLPPSEWPVFYSLEAWHIGCRGIRPLSSLLLYCCCGLFWPRQVQHRDIRSAFQPGARGQVHYSTALLGWPAAALPHGRLQSVLHRQQAVGEGLDGILAFDISSSERRRTFSASALARR